MPEPPRWITATRRHPDAAAVAALLLIPALALGRALWPGRVLSPADHLLTMVPWRALAPGHSPANPLLGDVAFMFQPWALYAASRIHEGSFPLWNPHAFAGAPFFANPQTALLFPLTWLAVVLPAPAALAFAAIGKLALAGLGSYAFLRLLSARPLPALTGAVAFALSAPLVVWLGWSYGTYMAVLPLPFAAVERLRQRGRGVCLLALAAALVLVAGYPQGALHAFVATAAYALCRVAGARERAGYLARAAAGFALGGALAAPQVLAFVEYSRLSAVLAYRSGGVPASSLPLAAAITALLPGHYGNPVTGDFRGPLNFNELAASVGLVPWVAAPVALLAGGRRLETRLFLALWAATGAIAYGVPPLAGLVASLPGFSLVVGARLLALTTFSLCVLGALGLDTCAAGGPAPRRAVAGVKGVFAFLVGLAFLRLVTDHARLVRLGRDGTVAVQYLVFLAFLTLAAVLVVRQLHRPAARAGSLALLGVELACVLPLAATYNPVIDARFFYPTPPAARWLAERGRAAPERALLSPAVNMGMLYGFYEVAGYDGMTPRRVEQLAGPESVGRFLGNGGLAVTRDAGSPVFALLGIRHVVTDPGTPGPGPGFTLAYDGSDARIWENTRALPRAFLAWRARAAAGAEAALDLVTRGQVDLGEEVVIEGTGPLPAVGPRPASSAVEIVAYGPERVVIRASAGAPAFLVLTDTWFPGWRARVDGREREIARADYAFRAVWLEPGRHEVEFRYRPGSVLLGAGIAAAAAVVLLAAAVVGRRR